MTDNTPIYMLGGNILPFGQGGMTTAEAKTSPLTLIVALANATAGNATDRCSGKCPVQQASTSSLSQVLNASQCVPKALVAVCLIVRLVLEVERLLVDISLCTIHIIEVFTG